MRTQAQPTVRASRRLFRGGPARGSPWQRRASCSVQVMLFDSWTSIARILLVGIGAYGALIVMLRISGKRTLAKMNAFDLVVTVALGSTLSTIVVSRDVPLADGVAALALLIALQFTVAWTSVRVPAVEHLVKSTPSLLLYRGQLRPDQLRRHRVTRDELQAAVRAAGLADFAAAGAVVLETDGSFSVVPMEALGSRHTLQGIDTGAR
jgi:uncharacterized membrane protein YcaP (DUF421 family)